LEYLLSIAANVLIAFRMPATFSLDRLDGCCQPLIRLNRYAKI